MTSDDKTKLFERMVLPHLDKAYNLARWLMKSPDDAEDAVQDAMLKAYKYLPSCQPQTARNWVLGIVRNSCFDILQARKAQPSQGFADYNPDDQDGAVFESDLFTRPADSPEALLAAKDQKILMETLIANLKPVYREVVILRELEDLSYQEIADITHQPMGTVMSRLSRAREQLQKQWMLHHE